MPLLPTSGENFYGWPVAMARGLSLASPITATFSIFLGLRRAEFGCMPSQTFTGLLLVTAAVTRLEPPVFVRHGGDVLRRDRQ